MTWLAKYEWSFEENILGITIYMYFNFKIVLIFMTYEDVIL
jgi:hypothetical protein